jgi:hypothetical protein
MKFAKVSLNFAVVLLAAMLFATSCTNTVSPKPVSTSQSAFSDNSANGGFIGFSTNGEGVITERALAKYNALIDLYGKKLMPPVTNNFGITSFTNNTYLITKEGLSDFMLMNQWYKDGKK